MWLKKLMTVSAELMKSAASGEGGKRANVFSAFLGSRPPASPRPSLPPFPCFVIGYSQIIDIRRDSFRFETPAGRGSTQVPGRMSNTITAPASDNPRLPHYPSSA